MKRLKYILIAALVVGLIVAGVWWLNQPVLPFDKAAAVEANFDELFFYPEENWMKAVYVEGKVTSLWVYADGNCEFTVKDSDGYLFAVSTDSAYQRWVQPKARKLSEGDFVKVWGYFRGNNLLPELGACVIERLR